MRIIATRALKAFWAQHPNAEQALKAWVDETNQECWGSPQDIKDRYRSASLIKANRVVFNIKGNDYRLIVAVAYRVGIVYIQFIGTHAQYDAVDAATGEMESP